MSFHSTTRATTVSPRKKQTHFCFFHYIPSNCCGKQDCGPAVLKSPADQMHFSCWLKQRFSTTFTAHPETTIGTDARAILFSFWSWTSYWFCCLNNVTFYTNKHSAGRNKHRKTSENWWTAKWPTIFSWRKSLQSTSLLDTIKLTVMQM